MNLKNIILLLFGIFVLSNCEIKNEKFEKTYCEKTNLIIENKILESYIDSFIAEYNVSDSDALCILIKSNAEKNKIVHIFQTNKYSNKDAQIVTYYKNKLIYIILPEYESVFKTKINRFDTNNVRAIYCKSYIIVIDGDSVYKH